MDAPSQTSTTRNLSVSASGETHGYTHVTSCPSLFYMSMNTRQHPFITQVFIALLASLTFLALVLPAVAQESPALSGTLPVDPNVRTGTLPNGVRYYLRHNTEPKGRVELRLAVNAGTALEEADQGGVAHFLEHMLFNGTERFEKQELINFLERAGVRFGPHVNAYTSLDETVYMLTIPTDSIEIVEGAFDVLEDWAAYATLSEEEIDKERGVIIEEWRARRENVQGRILEKTVPFLLGDSRYAETLFAGKPEVIQNLDYDVFRRFYEDWYRPDLMAVVAVGDIDLDWYEQLIREHFSHLSTPENPRSRPDLSVPLREHDDYLVIADPEYPYTTVQVNYLRPAEDDSTVADYRENLISSLVNSMLNERLSEIAREPNSPFLSASVSAYRLVRPIQVSGLFAQVQEDSIAKGLEAILTEAKRVREHGFTPTELERRKLEYLRAYEKAYTERENTNSAAYADEYVSNFLEGEPIPGIAFEYELVKRLLPEITLAEVNERANEILAGDAPGVIVTMPEKPDLKQPSSAELATVFETVQHKVVAPYVDSISDKPLLTVIPEPAAVTFRHTIPELDVTEITLANGVRLVMKPTDFKKDEIRFTAFSPGGSSLVPDEDVFEAELAPTLVVQSGLGSFTRTELDKLLAGKVVSVAPNIGELEEGLSGSASPQDLETMFQLIHLYFTAPRADSSALVTLQNQYQAYLTNRSAQPGAAFQDSIQVALYGNHPRRQVPTLKDVAEFDLNTAFEIYRDRFADAGDFTFVFVGNFDVDSLTSLAQTYLGTLPTMQRTETWRDVYPDLPDGVVMKVARKGIAPQSQVAIVFNGPFEYNRKHRHALRTMADVLSLRLREELREERGGVYGVGVQPVTISEPDPQYRLVINFTTDPARVDELIQAVHEQIDSLQVNGPSADDLAKVREQQRREREVQIETNPFWLGTLHFYYNQDEENVLDVLTYPELIRDITAQDVQEAARKYLNKERYVQVVLYPENHEQ